MTNSEPQRDLHLAATFSAAGITEYGIHIKFPDQQFMHPILGRRGVWTTDKALAEHELSGLRENAHFRDSNIRLVARSISPIWEVNE